MCPDLEYLVIDNDITVTSAALKAIVGSRHNSSDITPLRWLVVCGVGEHVMKWRTSV